MARKRSKAERKADAQFRAWKKARDVRAAADAVEVRKKLAKDPDWLRLKRDGDKLPYSEKRKLRNCVTKKAVRALFPQYRVRCQGGSGTAHGWVHVSIEIPEFTGTSWKETGNQQRDIKDRTRAMLDVVGIQYGKYLPDCVPGKDEMTSCLSVQINDINMGHY